MRTTLLGSLLDAARHNRSRGARTSGCSRSARSTSPRERPASPTAAGRARDRRHRAPSASRPRAPPSAAARRRAADRPRPPAVAGASRSRRAADFFAAKGVLEARAGRAARAAGRVEPAREPFLHPGRAARVLVGGEATAGWLGRAAPRRRRRVGPRRRAPASSSTSASCSPRRRRRRATRTSRRSRPSAQDLAVVVPRATCPPRELLDVVREAGGALLRDAPRCSTSTRARRWARARARSRCGSSSARPTARSPTRRSPSCARRSSPRLRERARGRAAWLGSACSAPPATPGALAAQLLDRHPGFELAARHRAQRRPARGSTTCTRARACRWSSRSSTPSATATSTPRSSPTRTAPRRRWSPRCASAASASSTCAPTSGCATARSTRTGTASTARRSCSAAAVYGLPELHRDALARRRPGRQPRLLPDRGAARRSRRSPARG